MNTLKNDIDVDFTIIPNILITFEQISWKAKGIFAYLASKPDGWSFYMKDIQKRSTDGKSAVQSGIRELESFGFLSRKQTRSKDGTLSDYEWNICVPENLKGVDGRKTVRRKTGQTDNPADGKTVRRKSASHSNTEGSNTEQSKTEVTNTPAEKNPELIDHPLQIGIRDNCPNICKIPDQLSYTQAQKLVKEFDRDLIMEKIEGLENKKDAAKKYTSVYLTLRSWCRMELKRQPSNRQANDKKKTKSTAQRAFEIGI